MRWWRVLCRREFSNELLGKLFRIDLEFVAGVDIGSGRPGLKTFAHGFAGAGVHPFVEFPFLVFSQPVQLRELE